MGDRAAVRRHQSPLAWDRLTFAIQPMLTTQDLALQRKQVGWILLVNEYLWTSLQFLEIWSEDGCTAEPEDDFA